METLRSYLNLESADELHTFMVGTKKKTVQMKYSQFVKVVLETMNPLIREFLEETVKPQLEKCVTIEQIEKLGIPGLPNHLKEKIVELVDKQKSMNIVEKTYVGLDCFRSVSTSVIQNVGKMSLHYARLLEHAPKLVNAHGKSF